MPELPNIFKDGIRFECQGSGKCCVSHGQYGYVFLSRKDRIRMAKHLKLPLKQFTAEYCKNIDGHWALTENEGDPNCIFLKKNKCSVYEGRPEQCRTWPFWPDVLTARKWREDVVDFCPGIGKGRLYTPKEIKKIASQEEKNNQSILANPQLNS